MSNEFRGTGNIGETPTLKTVSVNGEDRKVAELRVYFDDYKPNDEGEFEQHGGFWLSVSLWGDDRAQAASQLLRKGARVHIAGRLTESKWTDKESGEERRALQLTADNIFLALSRVKEVRFHPKRETAEKAADAATAG